MISLTHFHWFEARRRNDLTMMMKKLENSRSENEIFKSGRNLVHNCLIKQSSFFLNNLCLVKTDYDCSKHLHRYIHT